MRAGMRMTSKCYKKFCDAVGFCDAFPKNLREDLALGLKRRLK